MELDFTSNTVELLLIKRMLFDKNWLNIVSKTYDKRWFRMKFAADVVDIVLRYYNKYDAPPTIPTMKLLAEKAAEKRGYTQQDMAALNAMFAEIMQPQTLPEDVVVANLKEFVRKNAFSFALLDNVDILADADSEKNSEKCKEMIETCLSNFDRIQKLTFNDTDLGLDYFRDADAHWEFLRNPDAKISTGWESVDEYTNGGFLKDGRMLALFMAQAGLGKSVFLSNLCVNLLKQNLSVVVISLEMSQDVYAQRFDAHISASNINKLGENEKDARQKIEDFYKAYPKSDLVIKEFPPNSVCTRDIQAYLENLKASGKRIDAIIVDYLNLVLPNKRTDSMFKDGKYVSEELRALSYLMNCPVISAVQSNSEGMNTEEIDMQNVSESRGIVHTADALFAIYQTDKMREEGGKLGFKVLKNRLGGRVGTRSTFKMDPSTLVLTDMTYNTDIGSVYDQCGAIKSLGGVLEELDDPAV